MRRSISTHAALAEAASPRAERNADTIKKKVSVGRDVRNLYSANSAFVMYL
jgi:hypothetical protein